MAILLTINGVGYTFPNTGDEGWGDAVTNWATAVSNSLLQKTGGSFPLTNEVDFGAAFGIKTLYVKSETALPALAGVIRLANADTINFRDFANSADLALGVNASDQLVFDGTVIQNSLSVTDTATIDLTLASDVLSAVVVPLSINNTHVAAAAAIAVSKLAALTASRAVATNASGVLVPSAVTDVELGYLSGATSNIQDQLDAIGGGGITQLSGDVTTPPGPGPVAATLATVNSNIGTFGSSVAIPVITVNGKGLITAVTTAPNSGGAPYYIGGLLTTNVMTTPAAPGEYRTFIKNAASNTGVDDAPLTPPSSSNGMRLFAVDYATAGTSGQINRYEIYVGVNKRLQFEFYQTTARVGAITNDIIYYGTTVLGGTYVGYDAANGIVFIDTMQQAATVTSRFVGESNNAGGVAYTQPSNCYFDILVTD